MDETETTGLGPTPFDAILVVSFGGPEGMDDVIPFLENVLRGRNVPRERMLEVAKHYEQFGGVSPINRQNRELITCLEAELGRVDIELPVYFGNRNWKPMLADTVRQMRDNGVKQALALFTSSFSSYSACRQYHENLAEAQAITGENAPTFHKLRMYFNHPGFIETMAARVRESIAELPADLRAETRLVFTAHSIPQGMADNCEYVRQLHSSAKLICEEVGQSDYALVFQSRSGPPNQRWLEPDICDYLDQFAEQGGTAVVISPLGFVSDHIEVLFDLDKEAAEVCRRRGIEMVRSKTAGTHPRFVRMIRELIEERIDPALPRPALGEFGPSHDECPADCCRYERPRRPQR
jgi:ferrochelatase